MSVIEASSVRLQTMADGTLRITCDVEPRFARDAFALFGAPGVPMALAALKSATHEPEKPKGGLLSQWAAMRCQEPAFQQWLQDTKWEAWYAAEGETDTEKAASVIRAVCKIDSRARLDSDERSQALFSQHIRGPWQKHCIATGATA